MPPLRRAASAASTASRHSVCRGSRHGDAMHAAMSWSPPRGQAQPHRVTRRARAARTRRSRLGESGAVNACPRQQLRRASSPLHSSALVPGLLRRFIKSAATMSSRGARGALAAARRLLPASRCAGVAASHSAPPLAPPMPRLAAVGRLWPAGVASFHAAAPAFEVRAKEAVPLCFAAPHAPMPRRRATRSLACRPPRRSARRRVCRGGFAPCLSPCAPRAASAEVAAPFVRLSCGAGAEQPVVPRQAARLPGAGPAGGTRPSSTAGAARLPRPAVSPHLTPPLIPGAGRLGGGAFADAERRGAGGLRRGVGR